MDINLYIFNKWIIRHGYCMYTSTRVLMASTLLVSQVPFLARTRLGDSEISLSLSADPGRRCVITAERCAALCTLVSHCICRRCYRCLPLRRRRKTFSHFSVAGSFSWMSMFFADKSRSLWTEYAGGVYYGITCADFRGGRPAAPRRAGRRHAAPGWVHLAPLPPPTHCHNTESELAPWKTPMLSWTTISGVLKSGVSKNALE